MISGMSDPSDPSQSSGHEHPRNIARNARYGLWLFGVYVLFYAGFVALSAFDPVGMGRRDVGGMNLAVFYGLGLIILAFVLAAIYTVLTRHARNGAGDGEGR
jgi:uncharacterized membrane protein (DUF485 family)